MKLQEVKKCCCGCSLETGSNIIGWLQIIGAFVYFATKIFVDSFFVTYDNSEYILHSLTNAVIILGFGIVLVVGIAKKRPDYINAWVIASIVGMLTLAIILLFEAVNALIAPVDQSMTEAMVLAAITLVVAGLNYYCLIVVGSFHKQMLSGNSEV